MKVFNAFWATMLLLLLLIVGLVVGHTTVARQPTHSLTAPSSTASCTVAVDLISATKPFPHYFSQCLGSGHALLTMREDWRATVSRAHTEIGVENVRFHGILDDDMATSRGPGRFSFVNIDSFGDFIVQHGMHAIIELSFMPSWLARNTSGGPHTITYYKGIVDPPSNFSAWGEVIHGVVSHLVERYGIDEISQWRFEVWNEPNSNGAGTDGNPNNTATGGGFWYGTVAEYYELYAHAARAVKAVSPRLRVGGPATDCCAAWITEFREYCRENDVPVDFISTHAYTGGANNVNSVDAITTVLREAKAKADPLPLVITEFGSSYLPGTNNASVGTCHDDYDAASFLIKIFNEAAGIADVLSYWAISDVFEEAGMPSANSSFNGDFGLVNIYGVPKPGYRAMQLLHEAGDEQVPAVVVNGSSTEERKGNGSRDVMDCSQSVGILALRNATTVSLLVYNQATRGVPIEPSCAVTLTVKATAGPRDAIMRRIDATHANPRARWIALGMPQWPTPAQNADILNASQMIEEPIRFTPSSSSPGSWEVQFAMPPQGVAGIRFTT